MRTRDKTYADYGFQRNEEKYIKYLARQPSYEQRLLLYDAAYSVESTIFRPDGVPSTAIAEPRWPYSGTKCESMEHCKMWARRTQY